MFYIALLFKTIQRITFIAARLFKNNRSYPKSRFSITIWSFPSLKLLNVLKYIASDNFLKDIVSYHQFRKNGFRVSWVFGDRIGSVKNKNVFFNYSRDINLYRFGDYVSIYPYLYKMLEAQGCQVFPKLHERLLWENKIYMHSKFEELNVPSPESHIVEPSISAFQETGLSLPCLIKEPHSCSSDGVHKVANEKELEFLFHNLKTSQTEVIAQQLLDLRKDLRVILVDSEIVLYYWRINPSDEWKPTASKYGSYLLFDEFPEKWKKEIVKIFEKFDICTGAFDIAWQADDLETQPYVLEISPNYQPNPRFDTKNMKMTYGEFKKGIRLRNSYEKIFVDCIFDIHGRYINKVCETLLKQFSDGSM